MTVGELLEMLEGFDQEAEIRIAMQPSWPMEYTIAGMAITEDYGEEHGKVVYIAEGRQLGYLPGVAKDDLGW